MKVVEKEFRQIESFVALFDVLGYKELIEKQEVSRVAETYEKMRREFRKYMEDINQSTNIRIESRCFSDTFLLYTKNKNKEDFRALIIACSFLYLASITNDLYLRGAIAVGDLLIGDDMEVGKPIVKAYTSEQKQDWMGCWIMDECFQGVVKPEEYLNNRWIVRYPIPLKEKEEIKEQYALNWLYLLCKIDNHFTKQEKYTFADKRRVNKLTKLSRWTYKYWDQKRKVENTKRFLNFISSPEFLAHYK
jgi:hypothetical protein